MPQIWDMHKPIYLLRERHHVFLGRCVRSNVATFSARRPNLGFAVLTHFFVPSNGEKISY